MRALIFEQWEGGHHYNYVECLAKQLATIADEVVVATTKRSVESERFVGQRDTLLKCSNVRFDVDVPEMAKSDAAGTRMKVARNTYDAILRNRPNFVYLTTGDDQLLELPLLAMIRRSKGIRPVSIEAIIHHKMFAGGATLRSRVLPALRRGIPRTRVFSQLNFVNFLLYEQALRVGMRLSGRACVVGDPVPCPTSFDRRRARMDLGLDPDARYLGMIGGLGGQKAIRETLAAFERANLRSTDRLLLAGDMSRRLAALISAEYPDLIRSGRLLVLNGFLSTDDFWKALAALDVHCSVYKNFYGLSSIMLKSLAQNVPVITANCGWTGEVARRFGVGHSADPEDIEGLSRVMPVALEMSAAYVRTTAVERLLAFHSVDNFTAGVTQRIGAEVDKSPNEVLPWSWVTAALQPEAERLRI